MYCFLARYQVFLALIDAMLDLRVITGNNLKTSLGGTQFGVNLQANTTACEHLSVDENIQVQKTD